MNLKEKYKFEPEELNNILEAHFIDNGKEKNSILDWANYEVIMNMFEGILKET